MFEPNFRLVFKDRHLSAEEIKEAQQAVQAINTTKNIESIKEQLLECAQKYGLGIVWYDENSIIVIICSRTGIYCEVFSSVEDMEAFMAYLEDIEFFDALNDVVFNQQEGDSEIRIKFNKAYEDFKEFSQPEVPRL